MYSLRPAKNAGLSLKGLVFVLSLVIFVLGFQLGQAYCAQIAQTYSGSIQTGNEPVRMAMDPATGNLYVTSPLAGSVEVWAQDGTKVRELTGYAEPLSVAVDTAGRLYVGDSSNGSVKVTDLNGNNPYYLGAGNGEFGIPGDIAISTQGLNTYVYVTDSLNNRVKVYNGATGAWSFTFGTTGSGNGQFNFPAGIAVDDAALEVYVVDQVNGKVQVFNLNTGAYKRTIGILGAGNGKLTRAQGVAVLNGLVYVADAFQGSVEVFTSTTGTFVGFIGNYGSGGGQLKIPMDVVMDGNTLFVANSDNIRIEAFDLQFSYSVTGQVKTPAGVVIPNVTVTLSAAGVTKTATTDSNGAYTISGIDPGDYTLSATATGLTFSTPLSVTVSTLDLTGKNHTATVYTVSGTVATSTGGAIASATMSLTGTTALGASVSKTATSGSTGGYTFTDILPGTYTLTATKTGYAFDNPHTVVVVNSNQTDNFTVPVYTISGTITSGNSTPISGVAVSVTVGASKLSATTTAAGTYTIANVPAGTYTVTPSKTGCVFTNATATVTVPGNAIDVNFKSFTISGTVKTSPSNIAVAAVTITLSGGPLGATTKTATTSTTGAYSFTGLAEGTYTLAASKSGYTFDNPHTVVVSGNDATDNFTVAVYSISGSVTSGNGTAISGVAVGISIGGTAKSATTSTAGTYTISDVPVGTYTVTPVKTGYVFTPASTSVTLPGGSGNVTGVNFKSFTLSGVVKTYPNNTLLSGVTMTLSGGPLGASTKTATTSAAGVYSIPGLAEGTYSLSAAKSGYTFDNPHTVVISGNDKTDDFTSNTYSISGAISTGNGTPISGVVVSVLVGTTKFSATTTTSGTYSIANVPAGSYTVTPVKTGYVFTNVSESVTLPGPSGSVTDINFKSFTLNGTVKAQPSNTAIAGATLTLSGGPLGATTKTATTSATGIYSIAGLANGTYTLTASKTGYTFDNPHTVVVSGNDPTDNFTPMTYSISGTITSGNGTPISGVAVSVMIGSTAKSATTSTAGTYTIADVPAGTYTVTPAKTGYVFTNTSESVTLPGVSGNVTGVNFKSFTLSGTVTGTPSTKAIAGVTLTLSGGPLGASTKTATTSATGTYSIAGLANGTYTLSASKSGYNFGSSHAVVVSGNDLTDSFTAATYSISGVTTTGNGTAIAGVVVSLTVGTTKFSATTSATGTYTISEVPAGTYTVTPVKTGYVFTNTSENVTLPGVSGNVTGVNFKSFRLTGTVKSLPRNTAIATVTLTLSGGPLGVATKTATTSGTGAFTIDGLANGTYTLAAAKTGYDFGTPQTVVVSDNDASANFTVDTYSISGGITTGSGTAISGVAVSVTVGTVKFSATTSTAGTYTIYDVPAGSHTVTPTKTGYAFTNATEIATVPADATGVNFKSFVATGIVKLPSNAPLAGVTMTLTGGGMTTPKTAVTGKLGQYAFNGLGQGSYTATPSLVGYNFEPTSIDFDVTTNDVTLQDIVATSFAMPVVATVKGPDSVNTASVRLYNYSGTLVKEFATLSTKYGARLAMGDLQGVGSDNIIVAPGNGMANLAQMKVYTYDGVLKASLAAIPGTIYGAAVAAGDIDGDGRSEIAISTLAANGTDHTVIIYSVGATYALSEKERITFTSSNPVDSPSNIAFGNLDGTGNLELIVSHEDGSGANTVTVYTLAGSTATEFTAAVYSSAAAPTGATVAAMNYYGGTPADEVVIGYSDAGSGLVQLLDMGLNELDLPLSIWATDTAPPISGRGTDLSIGRNGLADPAIVKILMDGSEAQITAFTGTTRVPLYYGVNAALGVIKR